MNKHILLPKIFIILNFAVYFEPCGHMDMYCHRNTSIYTVTWVLVLLISLWIVWHVRISMHMLVQVQACTCLHLQAECWHFTLIIIHMCVYIATCVHVAIWYAVPCMCIVSTLHEVGTHHHARDTNNATWYMHRSACSETVDTGKPYVYMRSTPTLTLTIQLTM